MRKLFGLILFLFLTHFGFGQFVEKEIFAVSENDTLWGSFISPQEKIDSNQTLVLFIAGSGPTDRNCNNPMMTCNAYKMLAEDLSKFGVASIRYDKRGIAASASAYIPESEMRFNKNVDDAKLFYDYALDLGFKNIVIAGHSEGSMVGMLLAQRTLPKQFISIAGAGRPIQDVLKEQYQKTAPVVRDSAHVLIDMLAKGEKCDTLSPWLYSVFRPQIQDYLISWMQLNPSEEIKKLECPVLIIQGTLDLQVAVQDAEILQKSLAPDLSQLVLLEGMNHVLKKVEDDVKANKAAYNDPVLPLHPDLVFEIVSFLKGK